MAINKVIFGDTTLIDLTNDTITPSDLRPGVTAHLKDGTQITGTCNIIGEVPYRFDYDRGYVSRGAWTYENFNGTYLDIYEVTAGHGYVIAVGPVPGTRFRAMFTTTDVTELTSGSVTGTQIVEVNNPAAFRTTSYTPKEDGYIVISKDNAYVSGLIYPVVDLAKAI